MRPDDDGSVIISAAGCVTIKIPTEKKQKKLAHLQGPSGSHSQTWRGIVKAYSWAVRHRNDPKLTWANFTKRAELLKLLLDKKKTNNKNKKQK